MFFMLSAELLAQEYPPKPPQNLNSFAEGIEFWNNRDPIFDANQAVQKGEFKFVIVGRAWNGPIYPSILCAIEPSKEDLEMRAFISDHRRSGNNQSEFEKTVLNYAAKYNYTLISSEEFPRSDYCIGTASVYYEPPTGRTKFRIPDLEIIHTLENAIRRHDIKRVLDHLNGNEPLKIFSREFRPLISEISWAAMSGDEELFNLLYDPVKHGMSKNERRNESRSLIYHATVGGNISILKKLIEEGHPINNIFNWQPFSLGSFITPQIFELLNESHGFNDVEFSVMVEDAKRDRNDEFVKYVKDNNISIQKISEETISELILKVPIHN